VLSFELKKEKVQVQVHVEEAFSYQHSAKKVHVQVYVHVKSKWVYEYMGR